MFILEFLFILNDFYLLKKKIFFNGMVTFWMNEVIKCIRMLAQSSLYYKRSMIFLLTVATESF